MVVILLIWLVFLVAMLAISEEESYGIELTDLSMRYQKFADVNYTPYLERPAKEQLTLTVKTDLLPGVFFNTFVHGTSDETQYKWIGLDVQFGLRPINELSFEYEHHSQHMLDNSIPGGAHFPVQDSVGFTWHVVKQKVGKPIFKE